MKRASIFFALNATAGKLPTAIQLLPAGQLVQGRDGRSWTNPDPLAVINASMAIAPCPIDVNHSTDYRAPKGGPSPASGWITKIYLNDKGETWGDVEWNSDGSALVSDKKYRFISPVFSFDETTGQILAILRAALTNRPNLNLEALNQAQTAPGGSPVKQEESMKKILAALGLPETATEDQALVALNAVQAKATATATNATTQAVDLTVYAPRADVVAMEQRALNAEGELKKYREADLKTRATNAVDLALKDRKIAPASKDAYMALCATEEGLKSFGEIMKTAPAIVSDAPAASGQPPVSPTAEALNADEAVLAKSMGYTPEQYKKVKEAGK